MENREFISAANLPATEANKVDVLCVDNGELKRKPAANLGGGVFDIEMILSNWTTPSTINFSHSYAQIKKEIDNGKLVRCTAHLDTFNPTELYSFTNELFKIMNVVQREIGGKGYIICIPYQDKETYNGSMNFYLTETGETGYTDNH